MSVQLHPRHNRAPVHKECKNTAAMPRARRCWECISGQMCGWAWDCQRRRRHLAARHEPVPACPRERCLRCESSRTAPHFLTIVFMYSASPGCSRSTSSFRIASGSAAPKMKCGVLLRQQERNHCSSGVSSGSLSEASSCRQRRARPHALPCQPRQRRRRQRAWTTRPSHLSWMRISAFRSFRACSRGKEHLVSDAGMLRKAGSTCEAWLPCAAPHRLVSLQYKGHDRSALVVPIGHAAKYSSWPCSSLSPRARLSSFEHEGHARPSVVVHVEHAGGKGGRAAAGGHGWIVCGRGREGAYACS